MSDRNPVLAAHAARQATKEEQPPANAASPTAPRGLMMEAHAKINEQLAAQMRT